MICTTRALKSKARAVCSAASAQSPRPMTNVVYSGYWTVAAYDQDPVNNLVMRHEYFSGDLTVTAWPKIDHENQSELKFQIDITRDNPVAYHRD